MGQSSTSDRSKQSRPTSPAVLSALCCVFYKGGYKLTGEFFENMIRRLRVRKEQ